MNDSEGPVKRHAEGERLSFLGRRLPAAFETRQITLSPGRERAYDEAEWGDALVVVERGEIELECVGGARQHLRRGAVVWLTGLPLRALHNRGSEIAVLVAVSRRRRSPGDGRAGTHRDGDSRPVGEPWNE
jgi:quercetin dioxygenase-like cupin family protein